MSGRIYSSFGLDAIQKKLLEFRQVKENMNKTQMVRDARYKIIATNKNH